MCPASSRITIVVLSTFVVPYLVGAVADRLSMPWGMWTILISLILVILFSLLVSRKSPTPALKNS